MKFARKSQRYLMRFLEKQKWRFSSLVLIVSKLLICKSKSVLPSLDSLIELIC